MRFLLIFLSFICSNVFAENYKGFVGVGLSFYENKVNNGFWSGQINPFKKNKSGSLNLVAGFKNYLQGTAFFGIEASLGFNGYQHSYLTSQNKKYEFKMKQFFTGSVLAGAKFENIEIYGKLGLKRQDGEETFTYTKLGLKRQDGEETFTYTNYFVMKGLIYGIGANFFANDNFSISAEYLKSDLENSRVITNEISIGVKYHF